MSGPVDVAVESAAIALERAAICLDCSTIFAIAPACPKCAAETFVPLERFLARPSEMWVQHAVDATLRVRFADVLHHAGNGLMPARAYAERLLGLLELIVKTPTIAFPTIGIGYCERVVAAIDATMERLYRLGETETQEKHP